MRMIRRLALTLALPLALVATATTGTASAGEPSGTRSLAEVLTADGNQFDRNWYDYDIVTEAVLAVIAADTDANSPVRLLANGTVPLTAFIPNNRAIQVLVKDLTGRWVHDEAAVLSAVAGLGIDTVEDVLLYHVVPGATITSREAVSANGAQLTTALGPTIGVRVLSRWVPLIQLRDQDPDDVDPFINPFAFDINRGNAQIRTGSRSCCAQPTSDLAHRLGRPGARPPGLAPGAEASHRFLTDCSTSMRPSRREPGEPTCRIRSCGTAPTDARECTSASRLCH